MNLADESRGSPFPLRSTPMDIPPSASWLQFAKTTGNVHWARPTGAGGVSNAAGVSGAPRRRIARLHTGAYVGILELRRMAWRRLDTFCARASTCRAAKRWRTGNLDCARATLPLDLLPSRTSQPALARERFREFTGWQPGQKAGAPRVDVLRTDPDRTRERPCRIC